MFVVKQQLVSKGSRVCSHAERMRRAKLGNQRGLGEVSKGVRDTQELGLPGVATLGPGGGEAVWAPLTSPAGTSRTGGAGAAGLGSCSSRVRGENTAPCPGPAGAEPPLPEHPGFDPPRSPIPGCRGRAHLRLWEFGSLTHPDPCFPAPGAGHTSGSGNLGV